MMLSGLTPGPMLFAEHAEIPYAVFASLFLATLFLWIVGLVATTMWVRVLMVPQELLAIGVILFVVIGSYVARTNRLTHSWRSPRASSANVMKKARFGAGAGRGLYTRPNHREGSVTVPDALTSVFIVLSLAVLAFGTRENRRR